MMSETEWINLILIARRLRRQVIDLQTAATKRVEEHRAELTELRRERDAYKARVAELEALAWTNPENPSETNVGLTD